LQAPLPVQCQLNPQRLLCQAPRPMDSDLLADSHLVVILLGLN
jgi:hypothetical protein